MVVLVGHALLLSSIGLDVNDIAYPVRNEVGGQLDCAMFYTVQRKINFIPSSYYE